MFSHPRPLSICLHLLEATAPSMYLWFTGRDTDCHWVCDGCVKGYPKLPESLVEASDEDQAKCTDHYDVNGVVGLPGIRTRASSLSFTHENLPLRGSNTGDWIDVQPDLTEAAIWWILLASGKIGRFSSKSGEIETILDTGDLGFPVDPNLSLRISPAGDFAAVFQGNNRLGCVFDLRTGKRTASLDRGDYRPETSFFPIAFISSPVDGRTLLITGTEWCRLDIIDPADGKVLTPRVLEPFTGSQRPPHHLDYFHGGLCVSPDHQWIADGGWVWHPVGIIRTWNLKAWLEDNVWESEDGASVQKIAACDYFWDGAICWVDGTTLVVWGRGTDDDHLIPAACLFDVRTGKELRWFPGPQARKPVWPRAKEWPSLFFDEFLFATDGKNGLSVWDIQDGARLLEEPGLNPIGYHPVSKQFLSLTEDGIRLSQLTK